MEVVVTTGAVGRAKLQSNHHHQQTNTQFFYRPDALPVSQPTVSKHWREDDYMTWSTKIPFSAIKLLDGWQEGHVTCKTICTHIAIHEISSLEVYAGSSRICSKGSPILETNVGFRIWSRSSAVSPQVTEAIKPGGRLPLLSARPAVTSPAAEHPTWE